MRPRSTRRRCELRHSSIPLIERAPVKGTTTRLLLRPRRQPRAAKRAPLAAIEASDRQRISDFGTRLVPSPLRPNLLQIGIFRAIAGTSTRVSDGTRTRGRLDHNQELYQLSYAHRAALNLAAAGRRPCDHPSMSFELGDPVPAFTLNDTEGTAHAVPADPAPPATVLVVTCNHCPYVIAWNPRLRAVAEDYAPRDVRFLAINANDAKRYPGRLARRDEALRRRPGLADPLPPRRVPGGRPRARRAGHAARLRARRRAAPALPRRARRRPPATRRRTRATCATRSTRCSPATSRPPPTPARAAAR